MERARQTARRAGGGRAECTAHKTCHAGNAVCSAGTAGVGVGMIMGARGSATGDLLEG